MYSWLPSVSRHRGASREVARLVVASLILGALAAPASASAAVTIGATGGSGAADCPADFTWAQDSTAVGSPTYALPAGGGVITSWSHDRGPALATAQLRLKVFRKTGPDTYLTVGQSDFETLAAAGVNTFATRVPVEGGDILGLRLTADISCRRGGSTGDVAVASGPGQPDPAIGSTVILTSTGAFLLNLAATVEPDCDRDGFGDETQDTDLPAIPACDSDVPETTITKGPKHKVKTKKRKAKVSFEFSSSEPGSTFECSLDGTQFAPCASPSTLKVKKGKHTFQVRAKDPAGNVDGTPASDDWMVKRKRKK